MKNEPLHRKPSYMLVWVSAIIVLVSVVALNYLFDELRQEALTERDEQLYSLIVSVDNNLTHEFYELTDELRYSLSTRRYREAEEAVLTTGNAEGMKAYLSESHLMTMKNCLGVVVRSGEKLILNLSGHPEDEIIFLKDEDHDAIWVCYDRHDNYYIGVEYASPTADLQFYALLDLDHFYDSIVPESLQEDNWIVFYDHESGLLLQNHTNQAPYRIMSETEIAARNDGYSIILEQHLKEEPAATTYEYANSKGVFGRQRIAVLPSVMTINGVFTIGIALDSRELYSVLDQKMRQGLLVALTLVLVAVLLVRAYYVNQVKLSEQVHQLELETREKQRNAELLEAQYRNSISQLQPHFLYNSLSSIREITLENPEQAADLLYDFTLYLRGCLKTIGSRELIPFAKELEIIQAYVNIEKMRLEDRLCFYMALEDTDFMTVPLGIQPLVENAIRHGIAKKRGKSGNVWLRSYRTDAFHVIEVEDDGIGFDAELLQQDVQEGQKDSIGLNNVIFRYENMMQAKVEIRSEIGKGTLIRVSIPV